MKSNLFLQPFTLLSALLFSSGTWAINLADVVVLSKVGEPFRAEVRLTNEVAIDTNALKVSLLPTSGTDEAKTLARSIKVDSHAVSATESILAISSPLPTPADTEMLARVRINTDVSSKSFNTKSTGPSLIKAAVMAAAPAPSIAPVVAAAPAKEKVQNTTEIVMAAVNNETPLTPSSELPPEMPLMTYAAEPPPMDAPASNPTINATFANTKAPKPSRVSNTDLAAPQTAQSSARKTQPASASTRLKVKPNQTLWLIANRVAKQQGISTQKAMSNIYAANPNAFINGNPNQLRSGASLILRDADSLSSAELKKAQSFNKNKTWLARSKVKPMKPSPPKKPEAMAAATVTPKPAESTANLTIVSPNTPGNSTGNSTSNTNSAAPNNTSLNANTLKALNEQRQKVASQRDKVRTLVQTVDTSNKKLLIIDDEIVRIRKTLEEKRKKAAAAQGKS